MKKQKIISILIILIIVAFIIPQITLAAWYNPFSWHIWGDFWNYFFHKQTPTTQQATVCTKEAKVCPDGSTVGRGGPKCEFAPCPAPKGVLIDSLKNATLTYPNPYDDSKTDTINLVDGHALIYDAGNIRPRAYDVGVTAIGDLDGDSVAEGVIGIYQGWGANRITPVVFVFSNKNGVLMQIDSALPDSSIWQDETQIKSLSINNGILSVNLLVLATKDQSLPHYQQTATVPKTIQYKLINGKLVEQQADQTADWKTYTNTPYGFSFKYPSTWKYSEFTFGNEVSGIVTSLGFNIGDANNLSVEYHPAPAGTKLYNDFVQGLTPNKKPPQQINIAGGIGFEYSDIITVNAKGQKINPLRMIQVQFLDKNNNAIWVNYNTPVSSEDANIKLFNLFLSTFKFTK